MNDGLWIVLIEWDGKQPPSKFYRRMEGLSFKVRGDKEISPLARRDSGRGVIFQEGAILTASESQARTIATIATDEGAKNVSVGQARFSDNFIPSRADVEVLNRINSIMGRRGPKPPAEIWTVSCMECAHAVPTETHQPINCPNCGGLLIHARRGTAVTFADPGGDVFTAWLRTRFAGPHWEPAKIDGSGMTAPVVHEIYSDRERETAELIKSSPVVGLLGRMGREMAFQFLDAIFISRAYSSLEKRLNKRMETAVEFFRRNGNPADFRLTEPPQPDLVDAVGVVGMNEVVMWLLQFAGR